MAKSDCKIIQNYKKGKDVAKLPSSVWEATSYGEIAEAIIKAFPKFETGAFSLSKETSSDPNNLKQSIEDFIGDLKDQMTSKPHSKLDLSRDGDGMKQIVNSLELYYLAEATPENEEDEPLEVIANMEKKEEERVREKLNSALNRFFKNNIPARESFKKQVKMEIAVRAIIDLNSDDGIIATVEELNSNMEKLLNDKYSIIVKYLKTLNIGEKYPTSLIDDNHQVREDALLVILKFYDLLITKDNHDVLLSEVEQGWRLQSKGVSNLFLDALHSYLIVNYLDDLSADSIGRYIGRDKNMDYPITKDEKGIHYKYRFGVDRSNRVNSWGVDARDVLREMGNFTKFLIEMIPLVNPETGEKTGEQVTPVQFMNAFTLVFANIHRIRTTEARQALISFSDNPVEKLRTLLKSVHTAINLHYASIKSGSGESELYTLLVGGSGSDGAINVFDLKVLDSVYRTLFLGKRSLYNIEQRYNKRYGLTSRYPLVETLASEILASTAMYYLITRWDRNTGSYVTEPKERFAEGNKFHNLRIAINKSNQINDFDDGKYKILSKLILEDKEIYEIKAGESTIRVTVNTTVKELHGDKIIGDIYGIFTKREKHNEIESLTDASKRIVDVLVKSKDGDWKRFEELNRSINLSDYNSRAQVLQNRTGDNKLFLDVLDFILLFTLLKFGADNESLATYDIFRSQRYGLFYDVLVAATRGLVIADINKKFREFRADNPGRYTASQLSKFIQDNKLAPENITSLALGTQDYRTIWESTARGANLVTFYSTEEWLKYYTKTLDIMSGEISRANIKNASGDSQPNYGLMYEGANPYKVINDSQHKSRVVKLNDLGKEVEIEDFRAIAENIFAKDQDLVIATSNDMEVTLRDGTSKSVKMMTDSELFYHAIYDKFIINMAKDRTAWILPTTYSDKVKYVIHQVRTTVLGVDLLTAPLHKVYSLYVSSLGYQYRYLLLDILNDYAKIFNIEPITFDVNLELGILDTISVRKYIQKIEGLLRKETEKSLNAKVKAYNDVNPNDRIELTLDSHFRILPAEYNGERIETLSFNESLANYALDVYTSKNISNRLRKEKYYFMLDLMKGRFGIHYLPTESKEADDHTKYKRVLSSHPVGKLLDALASNDGLWISNGNSLILAKNGNDEITNINDLKESSTINPILERFFLIHSLLGNNLRMLHSGSELNHRNKELEKYNWTAKIGGMLKIENASKLSVIKKYSPSLYNAIIQAARIYGISAKQAERFWNTLSAENVRTIISFLPPEEVEPYDDLLQLMLYETEATSLGAQLKRNVSIPATMRPYTPSMRGISKTMNLAIMKDIRALIYNINGDIDEEDAHDGSALINGVTSIHENWSLSENEVGSIKKPIWHSYNNRHATAGLVKFAAHTLTNNLIRNSLSAVDLIKIDKKMNGWNWELITELVAGRDLDSLNLLAIAAHNTMGNTTFKHLVGGNATEVFYEGTEGNYWAITDFDYAIESDDDGNAIPGSYGTYTTTEYLSTINGTLTGNAITVYHYFDANSEHVKSDHLLSKDELLARGLHRAHSIYELKQMFGGAYSMEKTNKKLEYSETSNYIAANFINNVTIATDLTISEKEKYDKAYDAYEEKYEEYLKKKLDGDTKATPPEKPMLRVPLDLDHFKLPLKTYKIDYVCNNSAIKNGAANRNESERFYNDEDLDYITMSTEYYGIQMDADHDADEAELTEFSQVISALDAGGRLHSYVKSIYKALGNIAIQESKVEFNALKNYYLKLANISDDDPDKEEKLKIARDKVYTVIGNTILANISLGSSRSGLTDAIVKNIKREFNLNSSHLSDDELKLPFSDSNLYSQVLSTFASLVTKKSIRKQYPGVGAVISPAYDMLMVYDLDGDVLKYDDVLRQAKLQYKKWQMDTDKKSNPYNKYFNNILATNDTSKWNKSLVDAYLKKKEDDLNRNASYALPLTAEPEDWSDILQWFDPLLNVEIYYTGDNGVVGTELVDLSDIRTYYEFMANPANYLRRKLGNASIKISSFKRVITKGRNLAPSMLSWKYKDGDILKRKNIYSSAILIKQFLNSIDKTPSKIEGVASAYEDAVAFYNRELAKDGKYEKVLDLLDDLANNTWNGFDVEVESKEAELIMSNIYQTKFGIDHHVSLAEVLKNPKEYFSDKPKPLIFGGADSTFYDLVMMKASGRHAYISFDSAFTVEDSDDKYYTTYWKDRNLHREAFVDRRSPEEILANPNKVVNEVYVMDEDNHPLFRVGRDILRTDLSYNAENKYFYNTKTLERVSSKNLQEVNGQVIEYVEFVTLNIYRKGRIVKGENGLDIRKGYNKFKVYNIDSERLRYASNMAKEDSEEVKKLNDTVIYNLMQLIVKSLYQSDSYEVLTLNDNRVKVNNVHILKRILPGLAGDFSYDLKLSEYISNLNNFINKSLPLIYVNEFTSRVILKQGTVTKERNGKKVELSANRLGYAVDETTGDILLPAKSAAKGILRKQINNYYQDLAKRKLASFEMARYFTASRIPAQTLLSFMAMKLVAFTGEPGALAYVSHWLTWLQGSDYKDYFRISLS